MTPFELLFGVEPHLPSLPAPDIERQHYTTFAAKRMQILHHACKVAHQNTQEQGEKYKTHFDSKAAQHKFSIGQKVWLSDTTAIGKNAKLSPNWISPYEIIDLNDNNVKLKIKNKLKVINVACIKP